VELKLAHIHDEDQNWLIRMCMKVSEGPAYVESSIVRQCEECGVDIWYDTAQVPPIVPGMQMDGEVVLCAPCTFLHQAMDEQPPNWILPWGME
jgi:hypothetical protein